MNRFFLELSYKGTQYHGWQVQPNALTVQELLDRALGTLLRAPLETVGCGRTDSGVHAQQFFAHFDTGDDHAALLADEKRRTTFLQSLNSLLPKDIAVSRVISVHPEAHARFDATRRSYRYFIHYVKDPFRTETSCLLTKRPSVEAMNQAASRLASFTDFSSFSKSHTQVFTNNCTIDQARWEEIEGGIVFHISANRFLRNMVRAIVGTLLDIGYEKIAPGEIEAIIERKNRSDAGASVPACGLHLTEVFYPYLHALKASSVNG